MYKYLIKTGIDFEKQEQEQQVKQEGRKALRRLKSGESALVTIADLKTDIVAIPMHSVFEVIKSTPCTGDNCEYCRAVRLMYDHVNDPETDEETRKKLKQYAGLLRAKDRYFFGFYDMNDGQPRIMDFSEKQAKAVYAVLKKNEAKLNKKVFEISKDGTGQNTVVTCTSVDLDDLTPEQQKHYEATRGQRFPVELFETCLFVRGAEEQKEDLTRFNEKYNVSKLMGLGETARDVEVSDEDVPF